MTSSEVPSRIPIKRPFAESGVLTPIADVDGSVLNYPTGFPSVYSVPASNGGKYLARGDINAIGNVATNDLFYHKCGGLNTFDADFAVKIGGYPKDAILDFVNGRYIHSVISLVDNNKVDFTGAIPTSSQASGGILTGSVDNVNWAYCNRDESTETSVTIFERTVTSSFLCIPVADALALPIGCFLATKSGPIIVTSDAKLNLEASGSGDMYTLQMTFPGLVGFGVIVYDLGTSMSGYSSIDYPPANDLGNWKIKSFFKIFLHLFGHPVFEVKLFENQEKYGFVCAGRRGLCGAGISLPGPQSCQYVRSGRGVLPVAGETEQNGAAAAGTDRRRRGGYHSGRAGDRPGGEPGLPGLGLSGNARQFPGADLSGLFRSVDSGVHDGHGVVPAGRAGSGVCRLYGSAGGGVRNPPPFAKRICKDCAFYDVCLVSGTKRTAKSLLI